MGTLRREKVKIAIFTSKGSPIAEKILEASRKKRLGSRIALIITDRPNSPAIEWDKKEKISVQIIRPDVFRKPVYYEEALLRQLRDHKINFICLCGYRQKLPEEIIREFEHRIIKSIPVVNPEDFHGKEIYGKKLIAEALAAEKIGVVVKFVEAGFDPNLIISQYEIHGAEFTKRFARINLEEAAKTIAPTLLFYEKRLMLDALRAIERGQLKVEDNKVVIHNPRAANLK